MVVVNRAVFSYGRCPLLYMAADGDENQPETITNKVRMAQLSGPQSSITWDRWKLWYTISKGPILTDIFLSSIIMIL